MQERLTYADTINMKDHRGIWAALVLLALGGVAKADPAPAGPMITPPPILVPRQQLILQPGEVGVKPLPKESL